MLDLELVLPCYNEAAGLKDLIAKAIDAAISAGLTFEKAQIVVVNNGSNDESEQVLNRLKDSGLGSWFRIVHVTQNQGYGYGLWSGLVTTTANVVAWSHADLQCDPKDVLRAYSILKTRNDPYLIIKGSRAGRNGKDRFVSRVFEFFALLILGLNIREINAQPKVFSRGLLNFERLSPPKTFAFDLYMLYQAKRAGARIEEIRVEFPSRIHGVSKWASNFFNRYKTILGMIRYMFQLALKEGRI